MIHRILFSLLVTVIMFTGVAFAQVTRYVRPISSGSGNGSSWANASSNLQGIINASAAGDIVWVAAGTYLPTLDPFGNATPVNNRDKAFTLKEGVKLYGGFAGTETQLSQRDWKLNVTTLSGDLGVVNTLTDNSYHVVLCVNLTNASVLDGFTVSKGYATAPWQSSISVSGRVVERYKGAGIYNLYSSTQFSNLTVTQNSADCTDQNDDSWGAGMASDLSSSSITDCLFLSNSFLINGNSFGVFGAGLNILGGSGHTLTRCVFANNTSGSNILAGSQGGGLYLSSGAHILNNCIFYGNSAQNGAAVGFGGGEFNTSNFINCSFANNTSSFAGTSFSGFADATFRNCIFWNNNPTSSSVAGRNEIFSQETRPQFWPTFNNCIIRDASGSPLSVTNTVTSNILNGNPLFVNYSDGDGADNIWGTADDGLRLQCSSPAIGFGTGSTPTTDFLNLTRTTTIDIGAYEGNHANTSVNPLATSATTVQISLNASGINNFSNCTNLVASVQSGTPYTIAGTVTAKVWVQGTQPAGYVRRHYEITPDNNASTVTGRVTLYFTQADFDAFNASSSIDLPSGPADAIGKSNVRIEKRGGISNNNSGLPNTYTGSIATINPNDADIVWNSTASRWELTFDVTGFSGFFVKTISGTLPVNWVSVKGIVNNNQQVVINWTVNEYSVRNYLVEKSSDGIHYSGIYSINSKGDGVNDYQFTESSELNSISFYRIKQTDIDDKYSYSSVIRLSVTQSGFLKAYPSPFKSDFTITVDKEQTVQLWNDNGQLIKIIYLKKGANLITAGNLLPGVYIIKGSDGIVLKLIKE